MVVRFVHNCGLSAIAAVLVVAVVPEQTAASMPVHHVMTYLNWSNSYCIDIRRANQSDPTQIETIPVCTGTGQWFYPEDRVSGQYYGADPMLGQATEITCNVKVDGNLVASNYAAAGDGHDANCLLQMQ